MASAGRLQRLAAVPCLVVGLCSIPTAGALQPAAAGPPAAISAPSPSQPLPAPPAVATPAPEAPLPWITAEGVIPAAPEDPGTPFIGQLAAPKTDGLRVYETPGGKGFGQLPTRSVDSEGSDRTWMPVIGSAADGWVEVLLPARRHLPSSGKPVNGAAGWVRTSDVLTKRSGVSVAVDLAAQAVTVSRDGAATEVLPVSISGDADTVHGRSFVMGRYATPVSLRCSAEPMLVLSAQSETVDGYFGQDTAVQAVHAFSEECRQISGYTQATPGCVIVSEADIARLLAVVPDGTPVTVRG